MKFSSFRLRIALLSALLAGGAIAGFSIVFYALFYQNKLTNLDHEITGQLMNAALISRPIMNWENYTKLPSLSEEEFRDNVIVWVISNDGTTIYQSKNWPSDLDPFPLFPPQPKPIQNNQLDLQSPNSRPPRPENLTPRQPFNPNGDRLRPPLQNIQTSGFITYKNHHRTWRMSTISSPLIRMATAVNLQVIDHEMSMIRNVFFLLIPITLLLVMSGAWWLSGDALKSIQRIITIIRNVTAKDLNQRASTVGLDIEFVELIQVFNQMMERLERSFQQASRFSADAAHELKTPLAILQGELERAVQQTKAGSKTQQTFSNLLDEVRYLSSITRKLLLLSLADAGQMQVQKSAIDFSQIAHDLAEDIDLLAPNLTLTVNIMPSLTIQGDRDLINQILQNLITNAIKYNLPNGWIKIVSGQKNNTVFFTISNASKGIAPGDRDRIFDRFHRGDSSRNRKVEGFGLGLSLSREIARAHGGELKIDPSASNCTAFTLSLPIKK